MPSADEPRADEAVAHTTTATPAEALPGQRLGALAVHPLLLAVHPALALWASNVDEVTSSEVWPTIWIPAAVALVAWAIVALLLRSAHRGAVVASVLVTIGLWAGHVPGIRTPGVIAFLAVVGAVLMAIEVRHWKRPRMLAATAVLNVLALVLVGFAVPTIAQAEWSRRNSQVPEGIDIAVPSGVTAEPNQLPDIFYLIPDRYPREDTLAEMFDFDNSTWIEALEARGFQVADQALANYPSTGMSLASTWNLAPIDQLVATPENPKDWAPAYRLLRDHALGRNLVRAGYEYIHMGTWWSPTSVADSATQNLRLDGESEFVQVFRDKVLPGRAAPAADEDGLEGLEWYEKSPLHTLFQWQELQRLADEHHEPRDKPRFVLAHITVPHEPYVFEADGSPVPAGANADRTREDKFTRQVQYVNNQIDDLLDRLLSGPREDWPMIVIQSDEGPHPAGKVDASYDWLEVTTDERREKLQILSAILMPGWSDLVLPEDLVSVNTWRFLLDEILGTDLGPIDAPIHIYSPKAIYEFVDVTDEIRG